MRNFKTAARATGRNALLLMGTSAIALTVGTAAPAAASPFYAFQQTLQIPGATAATPFTGYDLATFDNTTQLYYLTDRSNLGIDVYSAATNSYVERITGGFAGTAGGNNNAAGPNGIAIANVGTGKYLFAGDSPSTVVTFALDSSGLNVVGGARRVSTAVMGGASPTPVPANRVDGVAYAPNAQTILAANNASNPGFITLMANSDGHIIRSIQLNGTTTGTVGGPTTGNVYPNVGGNGVEATIYNTARGSFFVAVPSFNPGGTGAGGVIEIDSANGNLLNTFDFNAMGLAGVCSPTGLVQGAGASMFVACSDGTAGHSVILNPTGAGSLTTVNGISGGDQVSYNPTTNTFYEAARFQAGGPVLGIIDGTTLALQTLAIGGNDHSVAVDPISGEVYVATAATTAFANCANGCIGVFAPTATPVPEPASLPLLAVAFAGVATLAYRRRA